MLSISLSCVNNCQNNDFQAYKIHNSFNYYGIGMQSSVNCLICSSTNTVIYLMSLPTAMPNHIFSGILLYSLNIKR